MFVAAEGKDLVTMPNESAVIAEIHQPQFLDHHASDPVCRIGRKIERLREHAEIIFPQRQLLLFINGTVTVLKDGFDWQGRKYKSLSGIAREITGTRWNVYRFFGRQTRSREV